MRDERFDQLVQVLGLSSGYSSQNDQARQLVLELALENAALTAKLSAIAEYEGLSCEAAQPIYKLTPKAEAMLRDPNEVGEELFDAAVAAAPVPLGAQEDF